MSLLEHAPAGTVVKPHYGPPPPTVAASPSHMHAPHKANLPARLTSGVITFITTTDAALQPRASQMKASWASWPSPAVRTNSQVPQAESVHMNSLRVGERGRGRQG